MGKPDNNSPSIQFQNLLRTSQSGQLLLSIRENISEACYITNTEGVIVDANQAYTKLLGYEQNEILDQHFSHFLQPELRPFAMVHHEEFLVQQATAGSSEEWGFVHHDGDKLRLRVASSHFELEGKPYKIDIAFRLEESVGHESLEHSENPFLQEIRHLFKNTLHEISGLIQLQASQTQGDIRTHLLHAQKRTSVIAAVFEQLFKNQRFNEVEMSFYLQKVLAINQLPVSCIKKHPELFLPMDKAYALGLILTEFFCTVPDTNTKVSISASIQGRQYILRQYWETAGAPLSLQGFSKQLVSALKKQLKAEEIRNEQEFLLRIPL